MIELEKAYLDSRKDKASVYFSRLIKKGVPLENDIRYYRNFNTNEDNLLEKLPNLEFRDVNSIVKFLFRMNKYDTNILTRDVNPIEELNFYNLGQQLPKIKRNFVDRSFTTGCILKQVKGGYIIELNGLVCFMPYSLSDGNRFYRYNPSLNSIQLFQLCGVSLVVTPEKDVFLNVIVSRKNNDKLLKGLLNRHLEKGLSKLNYSILNNKNGLRMPEFRLLSSLNSEKKGIIKKIYF